MGRRRSEPCTSSIIISPRLKREDCLRTHHDSAFSLWKILLGPTDWEDYSLGKEGAERYRVCNLPRNCLSAGVYEFGIAALPTRWRKAAKLDPYQIVVVYVGQADNIRTRLQQYGRFGAHLENSSGLFKDTFARGYYIVFRWAPMQTKQGAEKIEAQLLAKFDYAWNKGSNGARRADDVFQKLERISSSTYWLPKFVRRLQTLNHKQVGVRIEANKLSSPNLESSLDTDEKGSGFLAQIFKYGRSRPRLVLDTNDLIAENSTMCGVALGDGVICENMPVKGRKRCTKHKCMRITGSSPKLIVEDKPRVHDTRLESGIVIEQVAHRHQHGNSSCNASSPLPEADMSSVPGLPFDNGSPEKPPAEREHIKEEINVICGVNLGEGFLCEKQPVKGRKHCEEHKGMRIKGHKADDSVGFRAANGGSNIICGVNLGDGFVCEQLPVKGRKRCEEHKGMKIEGKMASCQTDAKAKEQCSSMCGAATADGSCRDKPVEGNKRCWLHKGMRADSSLPGSKTETKSVVCGVPLQSGSACARMSVHGRKRCEQHKGLRVTSCY